MKKSAGGVPEDDPKEATFRSSLSQDVRAMLGEYARARREKADRSRYERHAFLQEVRNRVAVLKGDVPVSDTVAFSEPSAPSLSGIAMPPAEEEVAFPGSVMDGASETPEVAVDVLPSETLPTPEGMPSLEDSSEPPAETFALVIELPAGAPLATSETEVSVPTEPEPEAELSSVHNEEPIQAIDALSAEEPLVEVQDAVHSDSEAPAPDSEARPHAKAHKSTKSGKPRKKKGAST